MKCGWGSGKSLKKRKKKSSHKYSTSARFFENDISCNTFFIRWCGEKMTRNSFINHLSWEITEKCETIFSLLLFSIIFYHILTTSENSTEKKLRQKFSAVNGIPAQFTTRFKSVSRKTSNRDIYSYYGEDQKYRIEFAGQKMQRWTMSRHRRRRLKKFSSSMIKIWEKFFHKTKGNMNKSNFKQNFNFV